MGNEEHPNWYIRDPHKMRCVYYDWLYPIEGDSGACMKEEKEYNVWQSTADGREHEVLLDRR